MSTPLTPEAMAVALEAMAEVQALKKECISLQRQLEEAQRMSAMYAERAEEFRLIINKGK